MMQSYYFYLIIFFFVRILSVFRITENIYLI